MKSLTIFLSHGKYWARKFIADCVLVSINTKDTRNNSMVNIPKLLDIFNKELRFFSKKNKCNSVLIPVLS